MKFAEADPSIAQPTRAETMLERAATPETRLTTATLGFRLGFSSENREDTRLVHRVRGVTAHRLFFGWAFLALAFAAEGYGAEVRLTWNSVDDPRASKYQVHFGQSSRTYAGSVDTIQTTAVISGLTPGQLHYFAVRACTRDGRVCSEFSNEVIAAIAADGEALPVEPCWACLPNQGGWRTLLN